jgi:hypothetical protein
MDGDDFSRATRLGRLAAESLWEVIANDAPFDGFATGQLIDRLVEHGRFLTVSRPTLRSRTPRPAKEVDRDLFAATR